MSAWPIPRMTCAYALCTAFWGSGACSCIPAFSSSDYGNPSRAPQPNAACDVAHTPRCPRTDTLAE